MRERKRLGEIQRKYSDEFTENQKDIIKYLRTAKIYSGDIVRFRLPNFLYEQIGFKDNRPSEEYADILGIKFKYQKLYDLEYRSQFDLAQQN